VRRRPARPSRRSMLRSRRDKPVYLAYDEDAFLAAPNGGFSVAPEAGSPSARRPYARRRSWKGGLVVAVAAATTAQLIASRVNDDQGRRSWPIAHHPRAATNHHPYATARAGGRHVGSSVTSASALRVERNRPRAKRHRHGRRARQAAGARYRRPLPGSAGRPPAAALRPFSPAPGPQPAATHLGSPGTGAAHEFGFEG
jgi:hypothetical protein